MIYHIGYAEMKRIDCKDAEQQATLTWRIGDDQF